MNLRNLAEADNLFILEDDIAGFAVGIVLTDLNGNAYQVKGQYTRRGVDIDPETGLLVPGNSSAVTVRLSSLGPDVLPDTGWLVETTDITGTPVRGKVKHPMLDRTAGRATLSLSWGNKMAAIPRSADDIIIDNMVTALRAFAAEQVAEDPGVGFNVERDRVRPPSMRDMPLVNVWLESLDPQREGSSAKTCQQELARINVDCYAKGTDEDGDELDDSTAMERLYYLKEQVKAGLYRLVNADFGMPAGSIGRKRWPSWRLFQNDLKLPESEVVAGRWSVEIEYQWTPEDIDGIILDQITVDAGRWSAVYHYEEG